MNFSIIPAIDIIEGKCVRLSQGDYSKKTIYDENPKSVAKNFADHGFKLIHVIDLDGAKVGEPKNLKVVEEIASLGIKVELGGGLREKEHFHSAINAGADGLIASPLEVTLLRSLKCTTGKIIVTPGIRPRNSDSGDQKRISTPSEALAAGADYLVIGRPIWQSKNPRLATEKILNDL